jgi:hypothetical protein
MIYREITNKNDIKNLQKDLDTLEEWAVENGMKINPGKCKTIKCTRTQLKSPLDYSLGVQNVLGAGSCKYLRIILRSDFNWVDHVNYITQKVWKALHFVMRVLKNGNRNTKSLAYASLVVLFLNLGLLTGIDAEKDRKCLRPSTNESCSIYKSCEGF